MRSLARHKRCTEGLTTKRSACTRPWQRRDENGAVCSFGNADQPWLLRALVIRFVSFIDVVRSCDHDHAAGQCYRCS